MVRSSQSQKCDFLVELKNQVSYFYKLYMLSGAFIIDLLITLKYNSVYCNL